MVIKLKTPRAKTWYDEESLKGMLFFGFELPSQPNIVFVDFNLYLFKEDIEIVKIEDGSSAKIN